jgi:hypothetical protein
LNRVLKKLFVIKGWQSLSFMLTGSARVKGLNVLQWGEGFKSSYLQPMCHLAHLGYVAYLFRLHGIGSDMCQPFIKWKIMK